MDDHADLRIFQTQPRSLGVTLSGCVAARGPSRIIRHLLPRTLRKTPTLRPTRTSDTSGGGAEQITAETLVVSQWEPFLREALQSERERENPTARIIIEHNFIYWFTKWFSVNSRL